MALVVLACGVLHPLLLRGVSAVLAVGPPADTRGDHLLILGGDRSLDYAAERYRQGDVRLVLLPRYRASRLVELGIAAPYHVVQRERLVELGVADQDIVELPCDQSPARPLLERYEDWRVSHDARRGVLLTAEFEGRITRWQVDRWLSPSAAATVVVPLPNRNYTRFNWWHTREGIKATFYHVFDFAYYCVRGPDRPLEEHEFWDPDEYEQRLLARTPPPARVDATSRRQDGR